MAQELTDQYEIIEEGLNGRTTVWEDPIEGYKSGKRYLPPCLETHSPLDAVIIFLGTNDLKKRFSLPALDIAEGAGVLVDIVKGSDVGPQGKPPSALLVAPPEISEVPDFVNEVFEGAKQKSQMFSKYYSLVAEDRGCHFLDASKFVELESPDGVHFEEEDHEKLGKAVASKLQELNL